MGEPARFAPAALIGGVVVGIPASTRSSRGPSRVPSVAKAFRS
jgi:hypothetical protein